jgi:hypothetical protein
MRLWRKLARLSRAFAGALSVLAFSSLELTWIGMWLSSEIPGSSMRKRSGEFTVERSMGRQSRYV